VGEKGDLARDGFALGVSVEGFAPGGALGIIDLAEIKHLALEDAAVAKPFVFDHTPIGVFFSILLAGL